MPVRKRADKRRAVLDDDQEAWLRGENHCGFVEFLTERQLRELWERYGDHDAFEWAEGMARPRQKDFG